MNVPEIYRRLDEAQKILAYLQMLTMDNLDMVLKADRHGKVVTTANPVQCKARTILTYENLWGDLSDSMFDRLIEELEDARRTLTARLLEASTRIQEDLSGIYDSGTVSFWREGNNWLQTYVHSPMWESRHRMLFIDGYRNNRGEVEIFLCRGNLSEMPEEYQVSFIRNCWDKHCAGTKEAAIETDCPPPMTDNENMNTFDTKESFWKFAGSSYLLH